MLAPEGAHASSDAGTGLRRSPHLIGDSHVRLEPGRRTHHGAKSASNPFRALRAVSVATDLQVLRLAVLILP